MIESGAVPRVGQRSYVVGLIAIVGVGVALRLLRLGSQGFWLDEAAQIRMASGIGSDGLASVAEQDFASPLSHIVLWLLGEPFGYGATVVRLPAMLAGTLAIVLIAELARRLYTSGVALLAAGLLAVSPLAVWYAQDGRMYSLLLCATLGILLTYQLALAAPERVGRWIALTVVTAIGIWTHQYAALTAAACGVHLVLTHRWREPVVRRWAIAQTVAALTYLPWLVILLDRRQGQVGGDKTGALLWLPYTLYTYFAGFSLGPSVRQMQAEGAAEALRPHLVEVAALAAVVGGLVAAGAWAMWRYGGRSANRFIACTVVVPLVIAVLAPMLVDTLAFNVRYVIMALPPLLIGISTIVLDRRHRSVHVVLGIGLLALTATSLVGWYTDDSYAKERLEQIGPYLATEVRPGDTVYGSSWTITLNFEAFGYDGPFVRVTPEDLDRIVADIEQHGNRGDRVWLVESREWEADPDHRVRAALEATSALVSEQTWPGVTIREYVRR